MELFDTHCHIDQQEFDADRAEVIARAAAAGVRRILAVGVTAASSAATLEIASHFPGVYAAVGIHPNYVAEAGAGDWDRVVELANQPRAVALGETGLDKHWDLTPFDLQQDYFDRHLRLSQITGKPVVVHVRDCAEDALAMLREARSRGPLRGILHAFSGDAAMAAEGLSLGLHLSFAGMATFKKAASLRDVARTAPADRLLVETDSPYLTPEPVRKIQRNEPAHTLHTARRLAEERAETLESFAAQTTANALRLFEIE